jgi:hypothetical protein
MRFDSKSVLLNDGINMKLTVDIPEVLKKLDFTDKVWEAAIINFNNILNQRQTVTEEILGKPLDILQLEYGTASIKLSIGVKRDDVEAFEDVWFKIKGQIVFRDHTCGTVEEVLIKDLTYTDASGTVRGVLNKA